MHKKNKGSIVFSEKTSIYQIVENEEQLFQSIENDNDTLERLGLYSKKLKKLSLKIYLKSYYFTKYKVEVLESDIKEKDIPDYIEYFVKEKLEKDNVEDFFLKYFKISRENYLVFIFDRDFIETLIEFIVSNGLTVENIFIQADKEYSLNDYDNLIHKKGPQKEMKIAASFCIFIIIFFSGITYYNSQLKEKITIENKKKLETNQNNDGIKLEQEKLEQDIESLNIKIKDNFLKKELFKKKIYQLIQTVPEEIQLERIYYEKNILNLEGNSIDKNAFFDFLSYLEKNNDVYRSKYDYLLNENNLYNFLIEVEVL